MMTHEGTHAWVSELEAQDYSATLTGNPFLFRESRMVLELLRQGQSPDAVRAAVVDGNLFQYRSTKSIPKRVNALLARLVGVPEPVAEFIRSAPTHEARLVLLLVLAVRDRLFRDFLQDLVAPLLASHDQKLSKAAVDRFIDRKAEVSPKVASWSLGARTKLRTVFVAALIEAGLARAHGRDVFVQTPVLTPATTELIEAWFPPTYCVLLKGAL